MPLVVLSRSPLMMQVLLFSSGELMTRPPSLAWTLPYWMGVAERRDIRRKTSPASGRGKGEEAWGRAEEMAAMEAAATAAVNFMLMI